MSEEEIRFIRAGGDGKLTAWLIGEGESFPLDGHLYKITRPSGHVSICCVPNGFGKQGKAIELLVEHGETVSEGQQIAKYSLIEEECPELAEQKALREHEAREKQAERDHEEQMARIELLKLKEQRLAAEAARDAAAIAKAQESEQFAAILKSLKDDAD